MRHLRDDDPKTLRFRVGKLQSWHRLWISGTSQRITPYDCSRSFNLQVNWKQLPDFILLWIVCPWTCPEHTPSQFSSGAGNLFCFTYLATYVSNGIKGRRHCCSRDCHGEDAPQADSLTGIFFPQLYNLHDNGWPARLLSAGTAAFHLCLPIAQYICVHFSCPVFSAHTHTSLQVLRNTRVLLSASLDAAGTYCGEAQQVLLSHPLPRA